MKTALNILWKSILFVFLTVLTQIGGIAFILSSIISKKVKWKNKLKPYLMFLVVYGVLTFILIPIIAPFFGRQKIKNTQIIQPTSYFTILLNRNYVTPELSYLLEETANELKGTNITINYLDANFPFIKKFPLLPHLSHNDGKKIDLSLIYETKDGDISRKQKSNSGYGVFAEPGPNETNQIRTCLDNGYFQYDYPKYLTFGKKNSDLIFSENGTKELIEAILKVNSLGKLFIEPHLKERLNLPDNRIRYHGCRAVRHDDHIHIQLK